MYQSGQRDRDFQALQERLTRLSEAVLRINESLDFDTVLQDVLDSARAVTGARYGVMTLFDDAGGVPDFLASGMPAEAAEQVWLIPDGLRIFESLTGISDPVRVPDLVKHIRSLGFTEYTIPIPVEAAFPYLATPLSHRGTRVGHIFVGGKDDGGAFTQVDEETLVMFASQAALVITNARTHRQERRARADLETLVNTSPVGIVVFDAGTGTPSFVNREARRIVEGLSGPDQRPEDLLEVLTFRRADGREVSLREYPLARALSSGETIRAEEIVIQIPDGRSVTALLNATPILSDEGSVESMVVTIQDLTDMEEQERLRAGFLAMVSHELRTPLAAIKGSITTLLETSEELDPAEMTQFFRIIRDQSDQMRYLIGDLLDVARIETGTLEVTPEPVELAVLVGRARSAFAGAGGGNSLAIDLEPDLPLVLADRRRIVQVLGNLLSNAARHSPESSIIRVAAVGDGIQVAVSVTNEGRGIPAEDLPHLFRKFSGVRSDDHGGDTGLGLAICKGIVEAHGGRIWAESVGPSLGARFIFTLPMAGAATAAVPPSATYPVSGPAGRRKVRILVVDDDFQALRYIRDVLTRAGYAPIVTDNPVDVPRLMAEEKPHLALLDLVLPGRDGIELMNDILKRADVPVIFLSAYGQDETVARAFDMGASDYLVKPFSPTELAARIRAALRKRLEPFYGEPSGPYAADELGIDYAERRVTVADEPVQLTPTEYAVLYELAVHAPRVLTHGVLLQRVWGPHRVGEAWLVRDVVKRLRRKLGDDADHPRYLFTEPRVGYRMPKSTTTDTAAE